MPKVRIGFSSDFVLTNSQAGIGTTNPQATLHVAGGIIGDFNISGDTTFKHSYTGLTPQIQSVAFEDTIGIATVGVGTFIQSYETESGNVDLEGQFNTVSEDIVVEDGKIFEVTETKNIGITTLGTQNVYVPNDSVVSVGTLESVTLQTHFGVPKGGTTARPQDPKEGMVRFNDDLNTLEFYNGIEWRQFTYNVGQSGRGVFGGGNIAPSNVSTIDYINISSQGNAINFGNLLTARQALGSCSSSTRGLFGGGYSITNEINYITIASEGNAISFGALTQSRYYLSSCSSSTRGLFAGGFVGPDSNVIDYVEISTLGNALDFGDASIARTGTGSCSSPTRGVFAGGTIVSPSYADQRIIEYVTISSKGNAVTFGDLSMRRSTTNACSSSTRGIFGGGGQSVPSILYNVIDYITLSSLGNATYFGDLVAPIDVNSATSSQIRGVFGGGRAPSNSNRIDYITIASTGNAQDFGDLTQGRISLAAHSDSHGGLGGF